MIKDRNGMEYKVSWRKGAVKAIAANSCKLKIYTGNKLSFWADNRDF